MFDEMNDEQLATHLNNVLAEQERRQAIVTIPQQIKDLTTKFLDGGGDPNELTT